MNRHSNTDPNPNLNPHPYSHPAYAPVPPPIDNPYSNTNTKAVAATLVLNPTVPVLDSIPNPDPDHTPDTDILVIGVHLRQSESLRVYRIYPHFI